MVRSGLRQPKLSWGDGILTQRRLDSFSELSSCCWICQNSKISWWSTKKSTNKYEKYKNVQWNTEKLCHYDQDWGKGWKTSQGYWKFTWILQVFGRRILLHVIDFRVESPKPWQPWRLFPKESLQGRSQLVGTQIPGWVSRLHLWFSRDFRVFPKTVRCWYISVCPSCPKHFRFPKTCFSHVLSALFCLW